LHWRAASRWCVSRVCDAAAEWGATFWVNGVHLVIQYYDYTPDGGTTVRYSFG